MDLRKTIFLITLLFPSIFLAQKIHLGVKGGLNISSINGIENVESREGYHFGGVATFDILETMGLHTEITYSRQGYKVSEPIIIQANTEDPALDFLFSEKLHYVNVPVLFNYTLIENLKLQAGPQFGFLIKTSEVFDFNQGTIDDLPDGFSNFGDSNSFDFGLALGAQYNILNFFVQGRYILGINEVFPDSINKENSSSNRNFQISIGYYFF